MTNTRKLVVYVGPYSFPDGGAAARRIYGNCLSLQAAGYDVIVSTGQVSELTEQEYNGIPVVSLNERRHENLPDLLKHLMYFSAGKSAVHWLQSLERKPVAVILYSGYSPYLMRLLPWARKNKVKLIFDVVEWYDPPNIFSRLMSPYFLNIELAMRFLIKKCDGLIVISEYLKNYYSKYLNNIVKVPPTASFCNEKIKTIDDKSEAVRFVYAGTPGRKKDSLSSIVAAILEASREGLNVELNIAGVNDVQFSKYIFESEFSDQEIKSVIKCHGILSHSEAIELVANSHYSIIIRPNIRSVQAGFSTKFVESMAVGTPVIANLTSDLDCYLQNEVNGLICPDSEIKSLVKVIRRSVNIAQDNNLRVNAKKTADFYFSPEGYVKEFIKLVE